MKIGLLGAGTIGFGVVELCNGTKDLEIIRVLDRRVIPGLEDRLTQKPEDILNDPEIDTVVELLGGVTPAFTWVEQALRSGKNVVTANKMMVSEKLPELLEAAQAGHSQLRFSAAVGGGIPFLYNLLRARRVDTVLSVEGILNGTTNYILTRMQEEHAGYDEVLKDAQRLGYAEADPTADVSGMDTECKIMLASCIAWNGRINKREILREGIGQITQQDQDATASMNRVLRLMARSLWTAQGLRITVEPTLVSAASLPAGIRLVENMACWTGKNAGLQRFTGAGAGRYATAGAVVNDLMDLQDSGYPFTIENRHLNICNDIPDRRYLVRGLDVAGTGMGAHILTEPMAPSVIHRLAKERREAGGSVFFAGLLE